MTYQQPCIKPEAIIFWVYYTK